MLRELSTGGENDSTKVFAQICVFTRAVAGPSAWKTELSHFLKGN